MKFWYSISFTFFLLLTNLNAQELNCQVQVNYSQVQGTDLKQVSDQIQKAVLEFMNNNKWGKDQFLPHEKIDCSILIILEERPEIDYYKGRIQIQARRPIYGSSYYSPILNIEDQDFAFKYQQFQQLDFNLNTFQSNLTSVLAFYAYVILATDYDTFSPLGGTEYWQKAQIIMQNAQNAAESGWRANERNNRNRYWIVDNALQPVFEGIRKCMYDYHRMGLDKMSENVEDARAEIFKALEKLKPVYQARPASFPLQLFFNAKRDEIINIYRGATPEEKTKVLELLMLVDPANTTRYTKIQE
ncbi:MAG: DUF4835 family protein [Bacteroidia bacterium]|nr:DUF4835 family protein [Bacteroidia bacterium]